MTTSIRIATLIALLSATAFCVTATIWLGLALS